MMEECNSAIIFLFYCLYLGPVESAIPSTTEWKTAFQHGFGDWNVQQDSWIIEKWESLEAKFNRTLPAPPLALTSGGGSKDQTNETLMVTIPSDASAGNNDHTAAMMYRDLEVAQNTNLELFFTCLVLGWNTSDDALQRLDNPSLQVLYDDVLVFSIENAIMNNSTMEGYNVSGWNQFRLFSSYRVNFTMRITIMASLGRRAESLVALQSLVIRMDSNSGIALGQEPEVDLEDAKSGTWEQIEPESEEDEDEAETSNLLTHKPEFCDLKPEIGPCRGKWTRYFYNSTLNDCAPFQYGGCDGNENNFHNLLACRVICQEPNATKTATIFQNRSHTPTNLSLTFDEDGFGDWQVENWSILEYANSTRKISALNGSSKAAATPDPRFTLNFPSLSHPIRLMPNSNITFRFCLRMMGNINPNLMPFFEALNPGFKIYIGDILFYDFLSDAPSINMAWHNITWSGSNNQILSSLHVINNSASETIQMIRIEAWQGSGGQSLVVLDDLLVFQTNLSFARQQQNLSFPCNLAMSEGPCTKSLHRFYFDGDTRTCKRFVFGGCRGNANNFLTLQDCQDKCNDNNDELAKTDGNNNNLSSLNHHCLLPREEGTCADFTERYYFDSAQGKCLAFIYKGCEGNDNNFLTMAECESHCRSLLNEGSVTAFPRLTSDCNRIIDRGSCSSPIQMWAFDGDRCVPFTYGGCGGNLNRFFTRNQCRQTCEEVKTTTTSATIISTSDSKTTTGSKQSPRYVIKTKSVCSKPRVGLSVICGSGIKASKYYYYDQESNTCKVEIACPVPLSDTSRGNRFFSRISCLKLCKQANSVANCHMEMDTGPCSRYTHRYFYNATVGKCLAFNYSGCEGNNNNFQTFLSCQDACSGAWRIQPSKQSSI